MFIDQPVRRRRAGSTLLEMLIAIGIGSILLLVVAALSLYSGRSFAAMANYADLDDASRNALDRMTRDMRQVNSLTSFATNQLVFNDADGTPLSFVYSPSARTLTRVKGGASEVLLRQCDSLTFSIFQRNPVGGTYNQYPTATASTAKLVQMSWVCSRQIFGNKVNTESVQTSKIVIRKQ